MTISALFFRVNEWLTRHMTFSLMVRSMNDRQAKEVQHGNQFPKGQSGACDVRG
jgi:hypothetical protein